MDFKNIFNILKKQQKHIATMESCTGGGIANTITNIEGASEILEFSAVTYSNEYKMKMGVPKEVIEKYTVYSQQTANEMSKCISNFASSDYGIGVTGKLNRIDPKNQVGEDNVVFISIYNKEKKSYTEQKITVNKTTRQQNKELIIEEVIKLLEKTIKE